VNLPLLLPAQPGCKLCPLHSQGFRPKHVGVPTTHWAESLPPSRSVPTLLCLGTNPGTQEDDTNEPFVGKQGQVLREVYLKAHGLHLLASIYFTNAARCWTPLKAAPTTKQYGTCLPYTFGDVSSLVESGSSTTVLCLGEPPARHVFKRLTGKSLGLKAAIGHNLSVHDWRVGADCFGKLTYSATYHPSYISRSPPHLHVVSEHLTLLRDHLRGYVPTVSTPTITPPRYPHAHPLS
jgi:uracil-DNA glycosylase family 4